MTDLARCDREIADAAAYAGPDKAGALRGEMDWRLERDRVLNERTLPDADSEQIESDL